MNFKNNKKKTVIGLIVLAVLIITFFGSKIPLINKIPIFGDEHEHVYRPVLDEQGEIKYWTCVMHPSVRLKDPGQCPICGMDLVGVENNKSEKNNQAHDGIKDGDQKSEAMHDHGSHGDGIVPRVKEGNEISSEFVVSPERQQLIGVKTQQVSVRSMDKIIRTVGKVELDETKIEHIHSKVSGWIDKVFVDFTWKHVKKGDPLFSIYSPELVSTQQEYLLALKSRNVLVDSEFTDISEGAKSLVQATRRRLELWDVSENQITELERTGKIKKSLIIYSPIEGHVSFKNAFENMYVEPKTRIFTIADHSTAWVNADIYEDDISLVKLGQQATITVDALPGEKFVGELTFIWPHIMQQTITTKARLVFANPDLKLLPEMYANVEIDIPFGEKLTVPANAVLRTGKQDIVFVDKGGGNLQIRKVQIGHKAGEYYEVLRGLKQGEMVVSSANFLIDSESKVRAAVASWGEDSGQQNMQNMKMNENKLPANTLQ